MVRARISIPGILLLGSLLLSSLLRAEITKLSFTCKEEDIQWAGMTCSDQEPCPVYLELASISALGQKIFVAGNIHSAEATLYSILLRSDDGGATWQEPSERARGEDLDHIQFVDFETGWVSGQRTAPLAGDPFFLITHDGGKTWRRSTVLADGGAGFIQKFHFETALSGRLVIDRGTTQGDELRYQLYESMNGGENWALRGSSDTPAKGGPVQEEESAWRLRAGTDGKTLLVEHRAGEKWTAAASFAIRIADCKGE
jgi:photosystem II stability/assembly factor-like uncharacterized protein